MKNLKRLVIALTAILLPLLAACNGGAPNPTVKKISDVDGKTIGVVAGSSAEIFAAGVGEVRVYASEAGMAAEVRSGAIDCAVTDGYAVNSAAKSAHGLKTIAEPLFKLDLAIIAAKQAKDLTADVNSALRTLRDSGVLPAIIGNYTRGEPYAYRPRTDIPEDAGTLHLAVGGAFAEYMKIDERGNFSGLDIDVARAVCDLLGVKLEISGVAPAELVNAVWTGKADFAMGAMYETPERAELVDFSSPYVTCELKVITRK
ncbi:MAG: transporter substrate-binding domain-containing protein [Oscillospiraceae bacterium]|jgi:polar amino acid transport system substrate-binding protein|nr:transporter substrate-binding domain-containing protein [Oscillospiraceae bacterium]